VVNVEWKFIVALAQGASVCLLSRIKLHNAFREFRRCGRAATATSVYIYVVVVFVFDVVIVARDSEDWDFVKPLALRANIRFIIHNSWETSHYMYSFVSVISLRHRRSVVVATNLIIARNTESYLRCANRANVLLVKYFNCTSRRHRLLHWRLQWLIKFFSICSLHTRNISIGTYAHISKMTR